MNVTLDQARTLDAFAREGTLQAAAKRLSKGHPAVLYALKQLEQQTGLAEFLHPGNHGKHHTDAAHGAGPENGAELGLE